MEEISSQTNQRSFKIINCENMLFDQIISDQPEEIRTKERFYQMWKLINDEGKKKILLDS